ncbi:MAG TPA: sulfatase [Solirubrobacteraceae bacterium]|nr:sulfatase [Solirubrobacteraceae bacterium]
MNAPPNIVYVHSHDTGRYIQPYGRQVVTPNIQRLADQGLLFRSAFAAAPSCSPSRAALLTGRWPHCNGMNGLAHRGFALDDPSQHVVHTLKAAGYWTAMVGEQHVSADPLELGYDVVAPSGSHRVHDVGPAAVRLIRERPSQPFFLSVGFFETHRDYFDPTSVRDALYSIPPANLPDSPVTRHDMAAFKQSARTLDHGVGAVLGALDDEGIADDTLVVFTTDHGVPFPGAKATLSDRGIGVLLILRGPGGFHGGRVNDALISQIDIFPTLCDLAAIDCPPHLQGRSLLPHVRGETPDVNDAVFAELTYHAAYDPQRAIRTRRHKYVRRFGERDLPVLANVDDSPTKDLLLDAGWGDLPRAREELYDLVLDPGEARNLAGDPAHADVHRALRDRLDEWMLTTEDPLLRGPVEPPPGAVFNDPDDVSAAAAPGPAETGAIR